VVIVHVPAHYRGSTPVALVFNLHGSESTARQQELFSGMDATSDADGFIVVYPQVLISSAGGYDWNVPGELPGGDRRRALFPRRRRPRMARRPKVPASISLVLGPQSNAVNANSTMWAFFQARPLP
jgi:poly(3-hydroxybutyrate) depolymerase